ncbi:lytic transglycosylase domain-containing protein [Hydrogenispora sp. UU3]|uniref:Lytic transglycosylase domain-containing protein n=2 Tax=Capillibacterium thermochitinicola TaxID=2699427 RepID=A0A8J6LRM8_9FIRM|nr:lytic transglycosylase domain-containing protein [Capillibacterium thermochitinicola]
MVFRRMLKITTLTLFFFFFTSPAVMDFITGKHEAGLVHDPMVKIERFIRRHHPEIPQEDLEEITVAVLDASAHYNIDYYLILSLIAAESGFRKTAVSRKGARGLTQLMPFNCYDLDWKDIRANIFRGTEYLRQQLERFGTIPTALAAYNAGPTRIARSKEWPRETRLYVQRVTGYYQDLIGLAN